MAEFVHKCNTCLAAFPSLEALKEHYRGDWHVLNSKRRAANQPPLRREQFVQAVAAAPKKTPSYSAANPPSSSAKRSSAPPQPAQTEHTHTHKKSEATATKKDKRTSSAAAAAAAATASPEQSTSESESAAPEGARESVSMRTAINGAPAEDAEEDEESVWEDADDDEEEGEEEEEEDAVAKKNPPKLGVAISLFDDKDCHTVEQNLDYMAKKFGFFLPDFDYLVDLPGLMGYLNDKVKLGNICLFCQKRFPSARSVQHHMISKSHCKICYEEDIDLEEYEDFYDFTSTYEDVEDVEFDENGEVVQEEMEISTTGELVLPGGRILGHRAFRRYYKQYYRPQEAREDVLALQREELLRFGMKYGGPTQSSEVIKLSEGEVMAALVKYHKQIRKGQIAEQQSVMRRESQDQRREYKSKVNKLRSSEITTAKIRDYHGMLK